MGRGASGSRPAHFVSQELLKPPSPREVDRRKARRKESDIETVTQTSRQPARERFVHRRGVAGLVRLFWTVAHSAKRLFDVGPYKSAATARLLPQTRRPILHYSLFILHSREAPLCPLTRLRRELSRRASLMFPRDEKDGAVTARLPPQTRRRGAHHCKLITHRKVLITFPRPPHITALSCARSASTRATS